MTTKPLSLIFIATAAAAALTACGGGGGNSGGSDPVPADRESAAKSTAENNADCKAVQPFYWEIGDKTGHLASGSVGSGAPGASTEMNIASSSKWLYAAYVVEKRGGALSSTADVPYLNFTSGYSNFQLPSCPLSGSTVSDCLDGGRGDLNETEAAEHQFHYNSGHMQKHAANFGLGNLTGATLATEIQSMLGTDVVVKYDEPQIAAGAVMDANNYARFLRKLLVGSASPLRIGSMLGDDAVCTLPDSPGCNAVESPTTQEWHYSLGHWVEDDAASVANGDTGYSSAGAFGFYPWVDANRTYYGLIAREDKTLGQQGFASSQCGRLLRRAYATGNAQ